MPKIKAINVPSFATSPAIVLVKGHQDKDDRTYVFWTLEEAIEKAIAFFDKHDLRDRGYEYPRSIDNVAHIFAYDSSSYRVLTIDEAVKYIEADGSLPGLHDEARGQGLVSGATKYVIDVLGIVFEEEKSSYRTYIKGAVMGSDQGLFVAANAAEAAAMCAESLRHITGEDWTGEVVIATDDDGDSAECMV